MLELITISIYFIVVIVFGLKSRNQIKGPDDFFVARRSGSSPLIAGSLLATIVGGSATIGMAGLSYAQGMTGVWWLLSGSIGLVILGFFFTDKVRYFKLYTLPAIVERQYNYRIALASAILIVVSWIGIIAGQIVAAGTILSVMGLGNPIGWMVLFTVVFVVYTILGGQYAVLRTDGLQAIVIFAGIFSGLAVLISHFGGIGSLVDNLSPEQYAFPISSDFNAIELFRLFLLVGLTYVVGPDMYSRLFCARNTKTAKVAVLWTAILIVPLAFGITVLGIGASVLFPEIAAEQAFPMIIRGILPPFFSAIVLAALLCAVMSSADTTLLSASTILTIDILKRIKPTISQEKTVSLSRWSMVVIGIGSLILALVLKGVINALLFAYTVYTAGLILPIIAGFYRNYLKVTPLGALFSIISGGSIAIVSKLLDIKYLDLYALLIGGVSLFLVSYIENKVRAKN